MPEREPPVEFVDGVVIEKMSPAGEHGALRSVLGELLNWGRRRRVALAFSELRGRYGHDSLLPDVAVYRWERITRRPDGRIAPEMALPPDIAVEIASAGQSPTRQADRCARYIAADVGIALLVLPDQRCVRRFTADGPPRNLTESDRIDLDAVLPGFNLTVADIFDAVR